MADPLINCRDVIGFGKCARNATVKSPDKFSHKIQRPLSKWRLSDLTTEQSLIYMLWQIAIFLSTRKATDAAVDAKERTRTTDVPIFQLITSRLPRDSAAVLFETLLVAVVTMHAGEAMGSRLVRDAISHATINSSTHRPPPSHFPFRICTRGRRRARFMRRTVHLVLTRFRESVRLDVKSTSSTVSWSTSAYRKRRRHETAGTVSAHKEAPATCRREVTFLTQQRQFAELNRRRYESTCVVKPETAARTLVRSNPNWFWCFTLEGILRQEEETGGAAGRLHQQEGKETVQRRLRRRKPRLHREARREVPRPLRDWQSNRQGFVRTSREGVRPRGAVSGRHQNN